MCRSLLIAVSPFVLCWVSTPALGQSRGFSIPQIDLAARTELQTIVDREAGQYLGHPTTILLEDGQTIIAVYPKGHGRGAIIMKRSNDGGRSWSERLATPKSWETSLETPTIFRTVDAQGVRRLILFSGLYPIRMAVGDELGETWSELEPIGDYGGIVAVSDLIDRGQGAYTALFHDDGRFLRDAKKVGKMVVYAIDSEDGGLTWTQPREVAAMDGPRLCEPGVVLSPNGKQIAVLLRENSRKFNSYVIFSDDQGKTWSEPRPVPDALTGDRHQAIELADGRLLISFRDMGLSSPTHGDWVAWVGTYDDIVNNREGEFRLRLMDNTKGSDCAYPALERLPDGTIVATTYGHWETGQPPYIVSIHLSPELISSLRR